MNGRISLLLTISVLPSLAAGMEFSEAWTPLMPVTKRDQDFDFLKNFTDTLNDIFHFIGYVIFDADKFESRRLNRLVLRSREQAIVETYHMPIIKWGTERNGRLRNIIGLNCMAYVQIQSLNDPILNVVDYTLEGLHSMVIVFVLKTFTAVTLPQISDFFEWCFHRNMPLAILLYQTFHRPYGNANFSLVDVKDYVYFSKGYPNVIIVNATGNWQTISDYMKEPINVNGYKFWTPVFDHPPSVFVLPRDSSECKRENNCVERLGGSEGRIYSEYISRINGTIVITRLNHLNFLLKQDDMMLLAAKKIVHIGAHPYSTLFPYANLTEGSFPIGITNVCIIVPWIQNIQPHEYIDHAFHLYVWIVQYFTFIATIIFQMCSLSWKTYKKSSALKFNLTTFLKCFPNAFLYNSYLVFCQAMPVNTLRKLHSSVMHKISCAMLLLSALLLYNTFAGSLTSLLNDMPWGKQIDTISDFLASDLQIAISRDEKERYFNAGHLPAALMTRIKILNEKDLHECRKNINTSYAYVLTSQQWSLLQLQQTRLRQAYFRMPSSELCSTQHFLRFPVQWESPFLEYLKSFFMRATEAGFFYYWAEKSVKQAAALQHLAMFEEKRPGWRPLTIEHFYSIFQRWVFMWSMATLCFICEIVWHRSETEKKKKKQTKNNIVLKAQTKNTVKVKRNFEKNLKKTHTQKFNN